MTLVQQANPGYGRAFNQLWQQWCARHGVPPLVAVLNTDLSWAPGSLESLLAWLEHHPDVTAATPQLRFPDGQRQFLYARCRSIFCLARSIYTVITFCALDGRNSPQKDRNDP